MANHSLQIIKIKKIKKYLPGNKAPTVVKPIFINRPNRIPWQHGFQRPFKPQGSNGNTGGTGSNGSNANNGNNSGVDTNSKAYMTCFHECRASEEYWPVCGTDDVSYFNINKLKCANKCGHRKYKLMLIVNLSLLYKYGLCVYRSWICIQWNMQDTNSTGLVEITKVMFLISL